MADVSIIIPTYNRLWSLPKAVESCHEAALDIEIIVIDDGSTDGTAEWLSKQEGLIVISQDNSGKDRAVNKGFAQATGNYIRFLDSDDWLLPGSTLALFNEAEKNGLDVVAAGYRTFNEQEQLIKETGWTICDDFIAQQLGECDSSHYSAYLFKKDFINDIPHRQAYGAMDDRQFIIEVAMKRPEVGYISQPTFAHRVHSKPRLQESSGLTRSANHLAYYNIFKNAFAKLQESGELTQRRKNAAANNLWHLAHWIAVNDVELGHRIYKWVYELSPDYRPHEQPVRAKMFGIFGFLTTEKLLNLKRNLGL